MLPLNHLHLFLFLFFHFLYLHLTIFLLNFKLRFHLSNLFLHLLNLFYLHFLLILSLHNRCLKSLYINPALLNPGLFLLNHNFHLFYFRYHLFLAIIFDNNLAHKLSNFLRDFINLFIFLDYLDRKFCNILGRFLNPLVLFLHVGFECRD